MSRDPSKGNYHPQDLYDYPTQQQGSSYPTDAYGNLVQAPQRSPYSWLNPNSSSGFYQSPYQDPQQQTSYPAPPRTTSGSTQNPGSTGQGQQQIEVTYKNELGVPVSMTKVEKHRSQYPKRESYIPLTDRPAVTVEDYWTMFPNETPRERFAERKREREDPNGDSFANTYRDEGFPGKRTGRVPADSPVMVQGSLHKYKKDGTPKYDRYGNELESEDDDPSAPSGNRVSKKEKRPSGNRESKKEQRKPSGGRRR